MTPFLDALVDELAADLGIEALLERRTTGLSGGERQRVALGRALSTKPRVLCLDEPLSALDEDTHQEISELIQRITREHDMTTLHITHSRRESEYFADVLLCLRDGMVSAEKR
ncbi:MAG: ATP-binding cassette domain-containing protein [Verrucomicrobia bacterium]|nr:ATP-binding cassette domain-containing protein [Verrucomicrobiota bacterium]MDA1088640.1 ATP-binding cassette domain-containing protein [Verrucomicrobiota bacterium]